MMFTELALLATLAIDSSFKVSGYVEAITVIDGDIVTIGLSQDVKARPPLLMRAFVQYRNGKPVKRWTHETEAHLGREASGEALFYSPLQTGGTSADSPKTYALRVHDVFASGAVSVALIDGASLLLKSGNLERTLPEIEWFSSYVIDSRENRILMFQDRSGMLSASSWSLGRQGTTPLNLRDEDGKSIRRPGSYRDLVVLEDGNFAFFGGSEQDNAISVYLLDRQRFRATRVADLRGEERSSNGFKVPIRGHLVALPGRKVAALVDGTVHIVSMPSIPSR